MFSQLNIMYGLRERGIDQMPDYGSERSQSGERQRLLNLVANHSINFEETMVRMG